MTFFFGFKNTSRMENLIQSLDKDQYDLRTHKEQDQTP